MNQDLDLEAVRASRAMDNNRTVLRSIVGHVREHLDACHPGEDVDCAGVLDAFEGASEWELLTLLNSALCYLARLPETPDAAAVALLDFAQPDPLPDAAS